MWTEYNEGGIRLLNKPLKQIPRITFGHWLIQNNQSRYVPKSVWYDTCDFCGKKTQMEFIWYDSDNKNHIEMFCSYDCLCGFDETIPIQLKEVFLLFKETKVIEVEL